jgi:hypothetical protein
MNEFVISRDSIWLKLSFSCSQKMVSGSGRRETDPNPDPIGYKNLSGTNEYCEYQ